jgi:alkylhydroperoxidase/carboxymuconolactone decarboxylase family protein YurZ
MVVDVTNGYSKFAEITRVGDRPVVPAIDSTDGDAASVAAYAHVKADSGNKEPDALYQIMAHLPAYLEANWTRTRLCFEEEGYLGLRLKHMIAFCVAATSGSDYLVRAFAGRLRDLGTSDEDIAELLLVIDLTTGYNRYVQGLQADMEEKPFGEDAEANLAASVTA